MWTGDFPNTTVAVRRYKISAIIKASCWSDNNYRLIKNAFIGGNVYDETQRNSKRGYSNWLIASPKAWLHKLPSIMRNGEASYLVSLINWSSSGQNRLPLPLFDCPPSFNFRLTTGNHSTKLVRSSWTLGGENGCENRRYPFKFRRLYCESI